MKISRRARSFAAFLAVASVLFAQLAISAYACTGPEAIAAAAQMDAMPGCDMAPAPATHSPLCKAHCQQAAQSLDKPLVTVAAMDALCEHPAAMLAPSPRSAERVRPDAQPPFLERPTEPSAAVRHCRFLI